MACTADGLVRGRPDGDLLAFLGIPHAKPPVGDLRWRPPQPPEPWQDTRVADRFGPMCPQYVGKEIQGAEDCLTVNVWRQRDRPDKPLPVMVWLTGGSNDSLSGEATAIIGNTSGETDEWADSAGAVRDAASYAAAIEKVFGVGARGAIEALYPASAYPSPRDAFARLTTDALFICTSRRVAEILAGSGSAPVHRYLFDRALENDPVQKARGAIHTVEHSFFFGWRGAYRPSEADLVVQRDLASYWTNLAKTGDPNGAGLPEWTRVTAGRGT